MTKLAPLMHVVITAQKNVIVDRSKNIQSQWSVLLLLMKTNVHLYQTVM